MKPVSSFRRLPRRYAVALGCEIEDAGHFVHYETPNRASAAIAEFFGRVSW